MKSILVAIATGLTLTVASVSVPYEIPVEPTLVRPTVDLSASSGSAEWILCKLLNRCN